ncbi:hypothetical protein FHS67_002881 [Aminobacter aminovorans]|uniref:Uncharacterized protein n=1 Tax=Aminobacter aminovorans TaxID=83263 RepID=A0AAC8YLX2_AMIAI|nr:hypothetical protein AA2016_1576 [Aminobacter aminovorans]MBB3706559.1 hypothetical protein [Aminobacter aminovorans]
MRKQDQKGRSTSGPRYVALPEWILACQAYRSLGPYARCLYVEIKRRYNGQNNGNISMSYREAAHLLGCSNKPVPNAIDELIEKGFIKPSQKGSFDWKTRLDSGAMRATTWILTELPIDWPQHSAMPATKEFMAWQPTMEKKTRPSEGVPMTRRQRTISNDVALRGRTNDTLKADHLGFDGDQNGTPRAYTYNIPHTPSVAGPSIGTNPPTRRANRG